MYPAPRLLTKIEPTSRPTRTSQLGHAIIKATLDVCRTPDFEATHSEFDGKRCPIPRFLPQAAPRGRLAGLSALTLTCCAVNSVINTTNPLSFMSAPYHVEIDRSLEWRISAREIASRHSLRRLASLFSAASGRGVRRQ